MQQLRGDTRSRHQRCTKHPRPRTCGSRRRNPRPLGRGGRQKFYTDLAEERYHVLNITTSSSVLNVVKVSQSGTGYGNAPGVVFKDGKWILATYYNYFGMDQESSFTGTVTLDIVTSTGTFRVVTPSLTIHYAYL